MPLTNAEKQVRARKKKAATVARYEAALESIARDFPSSCDWQIQACACQIVARQALNPDAKDV